MSPVHQARRLEEELSSIKQQMNDLVTLVSVGVSVGSLLVNHSVNILLYAFDNECYIKLSTKYLMNLSCCWVGELRR